MQENTCHKTDNTMVQQFNRSTCACNECSYMRLNTLEKLYDCLKNESPEIKVDAEIAEKAVKPIKRMLEISAQLGL